MNYFWLDASALVKRYVAETGTPVVNYFFTRVPLQQMLCLLESVGEIISVFVRRRSMDEQSPDLVLIKLCWISVRK